MDLVIGELYKRVARHPSSYFTYYDVTGLTPKLLVEDFEEGGIYANSINGVFVMKPVCIFGHTPLLYLGLTPVREPSKEPPFYLFLCSINESPREICCQGGNFQLVPC